jgi:threonylcarbamoyladenosine tRNA methylthiotransferase MtaB
MPQVEVPVRKERAARLRKAGEVARHLYLTSRIGTTSEILVEKATRGRSEDYFEVDLDQEYPAGAIVSVRLFALNNGVLTAQALDGPSS